MGRAIGRVSFAGKRPSKYAIHCNTTGVTWRALYSDQAAAIAALERREAGDETAFEQRDVPIVSADVRIGFLEIAFARRFVEGDTQSDPPYVLATEDRVFVPEMFDRGDRLVEVEGTMHIGCHINSMLGTYWAPVCNVALPWDERQRDVLLDEAYGRDLNLCADCVARIFA